MKTEMKTEKEINWETIKTELQNKLKAIKNEQDMKEFCEDIFGGFLYTNKDEIKKSIMQSETEMNLKPHTSERNYIG